MSFPPPYVTGHRSFSTLRGLERAVERFKGEVLGFDTRDNVLRIRWPAGVHEYPVMVESGGGTRIELQLQYDLES